MADLNGAFERLFRAVERLERATADHLPRTAGERQHLASELADAQGELARMSHVSDTVADRLDGAIDVIRSTLRGG